MRRLLTAAWCGVGASLVTLAATAWPSRGAWIAGAASALSFFLWRALKARQRDIARLSAEYLAVRAAKEAADARSVAKSTFLSSMSHEIRTPMTSILGYTELLADDGDAMTADERRHHIATIQRNGNHLLSLINDVLDVSKIEAGRLDLELICANPRDVVEECVALMRGRIEKKGLRLQMVVDDSVPSMIETDPTRLRQITLNLLSNALKFTDAGGIDVLLSCDATAALLSISVKDTGIGLTPEQVEAIENFDAFRQAECSTARRFGGTGLGLCLSHSFARMLGGGLSVSSVAGEGSVFTATIGLGTVDGDVVEGEDATTSAVPAATPDSPLSGLRVLLAEDGVDNQRLIRALLERAGARVELAIDGQEAVDEASGGSGGFDVIFMDVEMPVLDGCAATAALRSKGVTTPIVALTAHAFSIDRERCLEAGCDGFLAKPVQREDLIEAAASHGGAGGQRQAA